ncbi:MAG: type II toxin-antitoxin system MqsA family antitoxin [Desulfatirhabdiaceae bacterium]
MMKKCNFCGATDYEDRKTEYLYTYKGNYLLVPNTPVEICAKCGMVYFVASVLKEIERRFFAIQKKEERPDVFIELPQMAFS